MAVPVKNFSRKKFFDFETLGLKYVIEHSESNPTKKFRPIFLTLSCFLNFGNFGRKMTESIKNVTWKKFRFRDFWFKIRFETLRIDSDQKIFFDQNSWLDHFSLFWPFWPKNDRDQIFLILSCFLYFCNLAEKWLSLWKYVTPETNFDFEIFSSKHVLKHSESIATKSFFDQNSWLSFFHYFGHFWRKTTECREQKITWERFFDFVIFGLEYVSKHYKSIPTKKCSIKNFWFRHFTLFGHFGQKMTESQEKFYRW